MMAIIINHQHPIHFTLRLESTARAGETVQSFANLLEGHFQLESDGYCSERVINVVHSGNTQCQITNHVAATPDAERRTEIVVVTNTMSRNISLSTQTVRHSATFKQRDNCLYIRIIQAQNG